MQRLVEAFRTLNRADKALFLLRVAHMQTIYARAAYVVGGEGGDAKALRRSNEYVHRLCGHATQVLTSETRPDQDASFLAMVARGLDTEDQLWSWLRDAQHTSTTEILSSDQLTAIERRCGLATAGPWRSCVEGRDHWSGDNFIMTSI